MKIMVIDEQAFFRAGVGHALSGQNDFQVMDCDPAQDVIAQVEATLPDIVLLGSDLGALSRLELGRKITRYFPNTKVIILSPDPDDEELFEVIKTAAVACLQKNTPTEELVNTIRRARSGEYPINEAVMTRPAVAKHVLAEFGNLSSIDRGMEAVIVPLTKRETQVLGYIADGNTNKQIGAVLQISEQTIKNHVSAILRKLNANGRAHAVVVAIRQGWISIRGDGEPARVSDEPHRQT